MESLPEDVLIGVLTEWVRLDDLAALDTACCNNSIRTQLLRILALDHFCPSAETKEYKSKRYFTWLSKRLICVQDFDSNDMVANSYVLEYLQNCERMKRFIHSTKRYYNPSQREHHQS